MRASPARPAMPAIQEGAKNHVDNGGDSSKSFPFKREESKDCTGKSLRKPWIEKGRRRRVSSLIFKSGLLSSLSCAAVAKEDPIFLPWTPRESGRRSGRGLCIMHVCASQSAIRQFLLLILCWFIRSWWSHAGLPSLLSQPNGVAEGIQILPAAPYISFCTHSTISLLE